jgi:disulfide bond formation protein DsbB
VPTSGAAEIPMDHVDVANAFFTMLTLLANAAVVIAVVLAVAALVSTRARELGRTVVAAVGPSARLLAWIVATVTTLGSLYYSEIANFVPCRLCWYQRICMYPLAVILLVGILLRDRRVRWYALPFVAIGAPISAYHWLVERVDFFAKSSSCSAEAPCTVPWFQELGYVTLAFMALSAFLLIGTLLLVDWGAAQMEEGEIAESPPETEAESGSDSEVEFELEMEPS